MDGASLLCHAGSPASERPDYRMISLIALLGGAFVGFVIVIALGVAFYEFVVVRRRRDDRDYTRSNDWTQTGG